MSHPSGPPYPGDSPQPGGPGGAPVPPPGGYGSTPSEGYGSPSGGGYGSAPGGYGSTPGGYGSAPAGGYGPAPGGYGSRPVAQPTCVRHPDRSTGLRCTRCDRPACTDCLREASVGYQCVDCVSEGRQHTRRAVTIAGAEPGGKPLVVPILLALNVLMFAWTAFEARSITQNYAAPLFDALALQAGLVADGEWWRVITAGFLHVGMLHLAFNMLALWIIGRDLEVVLGRGRFLAVYMISLLGGSATVMVFQPDARVAGASGAVFGLMGALAVVLARMRVPAGQVIGLIVVNLVLSVVLPNISLMAHLGGLAVGAIATAALVYAPAKHRNAVQAAALGGLTLALVAAVAVAGTLAA